MDFYFCTKLCNNTQQLEGADFRYDNMFSRLLPKTPKSGIFGSKFPVFYFCTKHFIFAIKQIREHSFEI